MKFLLLISVYITITVEIFSQTTPKLSWSRTFNGAGNASEIFRDMYVNESGIYIVGGYNLQRNNPDGFFIKYSLEGDSLLFFAYSSPDPIRDELYSVVIDSSKNIYVTGESVNNLNDRRIILGKYDSSGENIWFKNFLFRARGLDLILNNNYPVLAYDSWEGPDFAHLVINGFGSNGDSLWSVVFKDDTSAFGLGGEMIQGQQGEILAGLLQLYTVKNGNVYTSYIADIMDGKLLWVSPLKKGAIRKLIRDKDNNIIAFTSYNSVIYKINSSNGEIIWEKPVTDIYGDFIRSIDIDQSNNIYSTGNFPSSPNIYIMKTSPAGYEVWTKEYNNTQHPYYYPEAIVVDRSNNIYIAGYASDSTANNTVVFSLSSDGGLRWEYFFKDELSSAHISRIVISDTSDILITGSTFSDIFLMKLKQERQTSIGNSGSIPLQYLLYQNYPNPFNPSTNIGYQISKNEYVNIKVFDMLGREVALLINEEKPAGTYKIKFNGDNLASGVYIYSIQAGQFHQQRKMILAK